jgi:hypothetical protein
MTGGHVQCRIRGGGGADPAAAGGPHILGAPTSGRGIRLDYLN